MKLNRETTIDLLETLAPAVSSTAALVELRHFWFDGKFAYGYDAGLGIRLPFKSGLECGLPAAQLLPLLRSGNEESVEWEQSDSVVTVRLGRTKATLVALSSERNPWNFPAQTVKNALSLDLTEPLVTGLKQAALVKAKYPVRADHYGVTLFPSRDSVALYATDSGSVVQVTVKAKLAKELERVVLPRPFVTQVTALVGKKGGTISFTEDCIIAELEGAKVYSNLLDSSEIPDLPDAVAEMVTGKEKPVPLPEDLKAALKRVDLLVGSDEAFVTLTAVKKELTLSGTFTIGSIEEQLPLSAVASGEITVGLDYLKALSGAAEAFAVTDRALMLFGKNDALFLIAAHDPPKRHRTKVRA